jgi:hypothetical protein
VAAAVVDQALHQEVQRLLHQEEMVVMVGLVLL